MSLSKGICLIANAVLLAAPAAANERMTDAVRDCRDVPLAGARLDCYDRAVDRFAEEEAAAAEAPAAADTATPQSEDTAGQLSAEELFGKSAEGIQERIEEIVGAESLDQIEARVTETWTIAPGKIAMRLDNGQVWRQVVSSRLRLSEGDDIIIRRASLGSYLLQKTGSSRSMRVSRSD